MIWRFFLPNFTYFLLAFLIFLNFTRPDDCLGFQVGVYGSLAIALLSAWGYTRLFIHHRQNEFLQFIHITIVKAIFFLIWGVATITSIKTAMASVCPNRLFFAHTSGTQFNQYETLIFFLLLFIVAFSLSVLINFVFWIVKAMNRI
ncbi:MAG TPA: hypothetical protein VK184_20280 [Nostocaceae cyanobacterium]|nr:hypothetical protein [Nostocaceae cyanobacterium]